MSRGRCGSTIVSTMTMPVPDFSPVPTKTVAYLRVSTEDQARHGWSLESQRTRMQAYAIAYNLEIVEWVVDDESASKTTAKRPQFQRALDLLEADKADAMLVASLDRFSRNIEDALRIMREYFEETGKTLMSLAEHVDTSTPDGWFMFGQKMLFAQREAMMTSVRTKHGIAARKAKGERHGGQRLEETIDPETVALIHKLYATKTLPNGELSSTRRITEFLNEKGVDPGSLSRSGRWSKSAVDRVLKLPNPEVSDGS